MIAAAPPPPLRVAFVRAPHGVLRLAVANDDPRGALYCDADVVLDGTDGRITIYATDVLLPLAGTSTNESRDVVLVSTNGTVVAITFHAPPSNMVGGPLRPYTRVFARYVIELAPGSAERDGIVPGAAVRIPSLAPLRAPVRFRPCRRDIR